MVRFLVVAAIALVLADSSAFAGAVFGSKKPKNAPVPPVSPEVAAILAHASPPPPKMSSPVPSPSPSPVAALAPPAPVTAAEKKGAPELAASDSGDLAKPQPRPANFNVPPPQWVCANSTMTMGVDVSDHQPKTDWSGVKRSSQLFAFIKATQGVSFVNPRFAQDWAEALAQNVVRSAYHFFMPEDDALDQAKFFLQTVGEIQKGDLPPMFDWEIGNKVNAAVAVERARVWLREIERQTGRVPVIYTSVGFWKSIGSPDGFEKYPLFIADFNTACPEVPYPWKTWAFWQHATGRVPGEGLPVDLDFFNGGLNELFHSLK